MSQPSSPKCYGYQEHGHMKQEYLTYLKSIEKGKVMTTTLSDIEFEDKDSDSDQERKYMVFVITIEESEGEVVENEPARDFSKDLGEKATLQGAYD